MLNTKPLDDVQIDTLVKQVDATFKFKKWDDKSWRKKLVRAVEEAHGVTEKKAKANG